MTNEVDKIYTPSLLDKSIGDARSILTKSYLSELEYSNIIPVQRDLSDDDFSDLFNEHIRFYEITNIVYNRHENIRDKLSSVFNAVGSTGASVLLMIQGKTDSTSIKIGMKCSSSDKTALTTNLLQHTFEGNFPGTKIVNLKRNSLKENVIDVIKEGTSVATVTDIPGIRNEENQDNENFIQGIEKFIDTMRGKEYVTLLIADHVSQSDLNTSRHALEKIYSDIFPFMETEYSVTKSESDTFTHSLAQGVADTVSSSTTDTVSHTVGKSTTITDSVSKTKNLNIGPVSISSTTTNSVSSTESVSDTTSHSKTLSNAHSISKVESDATGKQRSLANTMQVKTENHQLKKILEQIDRTLERYDECSDLGMWNCAVYCISKFPYISQMAASVFQSIIRGRNSSLEEGGITLWNLEQSKKIIDSLCFLEHPQIIINNRILTPGTLVSSKELAILAGFPMHSVPGIPVLECAEFGRTVSTYDKINLVENENILLGEIWHMNHKEVLPVQLDLDSLASHTFITGSTGSGKSNTVYQLLSSLIKKEIKFLVIEPAKGEYKNVFGSNSDVRMFGTNPELSPLLKINPFSFPHDNEDSSKNIHILEHLDRLIEIFNVCWPMYAAMPVVLKEAVEKSYEDCGWNLTESKNKYGSALYPTFADVMRNIRMIIDSSEYDTENKGSYKGSLITRLKSLTNGINGLIFTTDELKSKDLFDENVIVDLSRVGSAETKSLIMGLLVLKLQEYRMTSGVMNAPLRHVTVLEEAHNLLKRTSAEQSQESGNLLGKSVEMLTNSIAEMRTYGEGFIIVDQAPALLDMSVIRNTNTKIIMRLPDNNDRTLVGKSANLNDDQIIELAKLPRGVAAVYQNEWVEAVLCKVELYKIDKNYRFKYQPNTEISNSSSTLKNRIMLSGLLCQLSNDSEKLTEIKNELNKLEIDKICSSVYVACLEYINSDEERPNYDKLCFIISSILPEFSKTVRDSSLRNPNNLEFWKKDLQRNMTETFSSLHINQTETLNSNILQCILQQFTINELNKPVMWKEFALKYQTRG